jgi:hypothetical protein
MRTVLMLAMLFAGPVSAGSDSTPSARQAATAQRIQDLLKPQQGSFGELLEGAVAQGCCKICRKGQACGNSCISWDKTCHRPPGCACQG